MSKTHTSRIQELEERVEIMDKVLEDNQEKMRMMSDMISIMRQHIELMNTHIVKLANQEAKESVKDKSAKADQDAAKPSPTEDMRDLPSVEEVDKAEKASVKDETKKTPATYHLRRVM